MIERVLELLYPSKENFVSLVLPTIIVVFFVVVIWVLFHYFSKWVQLKADIWLVSLPEKNIKLEKSTFKKFVITYISTITKSISSFRIFSATYLILKLISENCKTVASALRVDLSVNKVFDPKVAIAQYFESFAQAVDKALYLILVLFLVTLGSIWLIKFLQFGADTFLFHMSKSKSFALPERSVARRNTLNAVTNNFFKALVVVLAVFTILDSFNYPVTTLLATAGIASFSFAFGAQSFLRDFIGGFFIVLEDQFAVGDQVEINNITGTVESMTFRILKIRSAEGSLVIIPNGEIRLVKNFSADWARVDFKVLFPLGCDVVKITEILNDELKKISRDFEKEILETPELRPTEKIQAFETKSNSIQFRIFIKTNSVKNKVAIESELNRRVLVRMRAENISIL